MMERVASPSSPCTNQPPSSLFETPLHHTCLIHAPSHPPPPHRLPHRPLIHCTLCTPHTRCTHHTTHTTKQLQGDGPRLARRDGRGRRGLPRVLRGRGQQAPAPAVGLHAGHVRAQGQLQGAARGDGALHAAGGRALALQRGGRALVRRGAPAAQPARGGRDAAAALPVVRQVQDPAQGARGRRAVQVGPLRVQRRLHGPVRFAVFGGEGGGGVRPADPPVATSRPTTVTHASSNP